MKSKRRISTILGICLAVLLLIPGGLSIKAEEGVEDPELKQETLVSGEEVIEVPEVPVEVPPAETPPEEAVPPETPVLIEEPVPPVEPEVIVPKEEAVPPVEPEIPEEALPPSEETLEQPLIPAVEEPIDEIKEPEIPLLTPAPPAPVEVEEPEVLKCAIWDWNKHLDWKLPKEDWLKGWDFDLGWCKDLDFDIDFWHIPKDNLKTLWISKNWLDGGDKGRPKAIVIELSANGHRVAYLPVLAMMDWKTMVMVPVKDIHGKEITYTIKEHCAEGYETTIEKTDKGFKLTNVKMMKLSVNKVWKNDHESVRPSSVTFTLLKNGQPHGETRTLSEEKEWKCLIEVPMYDEEGKIHYTVMEEVIEGYESSVSYCDGHMDESSRKDKDCDHDHDHCDMDITITNEFTNEKEITLKKIWVDEDPEDRPSEVTFELFRNHEEILKIPLTEEMDWMDTRTVLLVDEMWVPYEYHITEENVPEGYLATVEGFIVTNKLVEDDKEYVEIKGEKTWLDDGTGRPEYITLMLMGNDKLIETMKVYPSEGKWMFAFTGKYPKYDEEKELITYKVMEEAVTGYTMSHGEGFDLVNLRKGKITISGEKTWDDLMNRPASITVYLARNGKNFMEAVVTPDAGGKWLYSFKDVDQFDEMGKSYTFSVSEKYVLGYEAKITGYDIKNVQQRATLRILKVNEKDKVLAGAIFEISDVSGKLLKTATTGADGTIEMVLPLGVYRVKEISPPLGYVKEDINRLVMLFKAGEVKILEIVNEFEEFDDVSPTPLPVTPTLPSTGDLSGNAFYLFGIGAILLGAFGLKKKR